MEGMPLYVGLMSGTSLDGVDACLASFPDSGPREHSHTHMAFPEDLRERLLALARGHAELTSVADADAQVADTYALAVNRLLEQSATAAEGVRAIGSHGQTVLHRPHGPAPTSIQIGDPHRIAVATGIDTVADFRRADIAAGGEGAPLAPAFHAAVFSDPRETRTVVNLGGIANVTLLRPGEPVIGFDTGPANILLDAWITRHCDQPKDTNGAWSAAGRVDADLLEQMQADPWFERPPPKSTGRERFDLSWVDACVAATGRAIEAIDVQATLAELTAATIADALASLGHSPERLLVCGGGAYNVDLLQRLGTRLPTARVESTAAHGMDPQHVEAMAFAWLAARRVAGLAGNLPSVTGATRAVVLGTLIQAQPR